MRIYSDSAMEDTAVIGIMRYQLSVVKIWACYSADGQWQDLASQNAHSVDLKHGIYIPIINQ